MAAKLDIGRELSAINNRNHDFYQNLSDEEKKSFSPYVLMRYVSNPDVDPDTYEYILDKVNNLVNINHWSLSKNNKDLLWKLFASCGTGMSVKYTYLKMNPKEKTNKIEKLLEDLYPAMKISDIKVLGSLMTENDKQDLFDKLGFDKKQRKEYE